MKKKFMCGCGQMFYAYCFCSTQTREVLLSFQFKASSNSAFALLEDIEAQKYIQSFFNVCPANSSCPITGQTNRLLEIEKRPGGLCPVGLWKKALSIAKNITLYNSV